MKRVRGSGLGLRAWTALLVLGFTGQLAWVVEIAHKKQVM